MAELNTILDRAGRAEDEQSLRVGRLPSPVHASHLKIFLSNVRDFLAERPAKLRAGQATAFDVPKFGAGLGENLKEWFRSGPRGRVRSDLLVNWNAGFGNLWQNLRDAIFPPKLPPLKVSSPPVAVPEIWSKNTQFTRVQALSIAFHVVVLVLIIVPLLPELMSPPTTQAKTYVTDINISPYLPKLPAAAKKAGGGGGGGEHNPVPASRGAAPKFNWTQLTPPAVKPPANPKLAATPTLIGPPELHVATPNAPNWGDPLAKLTTDSSGPGSGGGIGSGSGGGVGSGDGRGLGPGHEWGTGGGYPSAGTGGYGTPGCLYCPKPEFSEEAMKAKYQGTVVLMAVITADGRAINITVAKGLGLGLDEKAVEAVRTWRFTPARGPDGRAASVSVPIEVVFRLY
ncbi:MAG TPA: energy transducer TonB [Candidatus Sulfotelmatobacter sp.]|nr:energy transducer TonB [Candidatus Sulfotelmatobacter sp.]